MAGSRRGRRWRRMLGGALAAVLLLALLEGIASLALVGHSVATRTRWMLKEPDRELVTQFDPELGWCTNPGFSAPNAYGAGVAVTTSAQGFRGPRIVAREVPPGRIRVIASGDSFTFGTGVGDDQTWCEGLTRREPRLETVNFGVGGYGIDQSLLRYRRDGAALDHDVHLFAFITEDVLRAVIPTTWGAQKPRLRIEGGELRVTGAPVEQAPGWRRSLRQAGGLLEDLRLVHVGRRLLGTREERPVLAEDVEARTLAVAIFAELEKLSRERGCVPVLVHLPVESEYGGGSADVLRVHFREEAERSGIAWIDLFDELRALPPEQHASLYLRKPAAGSGHYNAAGHDLVAELLWRELSALPAIQAKLAGLE